MILNIEKTEDGNLLVNLPDKTSETLETDESDFCKKFCALLEREMPEQAIEAAPGELTDSARETEGKLPKVRFGEAKTLSELEDVGAAYLHDNAAALGRTVHRAAKRLTGSGPSGRGRRFAQR